MQWKMHNGLFKKKQNNKTTKKQAKTKQKSSFK